MSWLLLSVFWPLASAEEPRNEVSLEGTYQSLDLSLYPISGSGQGVDYAPNNPGLGHLGFARDWWRLSLGLRLVNARKVSQFGRTRAIDLEFGATGALGEREVDVVVYFERYKGMYLNRVATILPGRPSTARIRDDMGVTYAGAIALLALRKGFQVDSQTWKEQGGSGLEGSFTAFGALDFTGVSADQDWVPATREDQLATLVGVTDLGALSLNAGPAAMVRWGPGPLLLSLSTGIGLGAMVRRITEGRNTRTSFGSPLAAEGDFEAGVVGDRVGVLAEVGVKFEQLAIANTAVQHTSTRFALAMHFRF